jgi:UPF0755 protein
MDQPNPYNTYMIEGMPPGPIANPGRASIEAAASPSRTKEIYFVADGTGGHTFSETKDQHDRAVGRLRAIEAQARDAAKGPQDAASPPAADATASAPPAPAAEPAAPQATPRAPAVPRPRAQQGRNATGSRQQ